MSWLNPFSWSNKAKRDEALKNLRSDPEDTVEEAAATSNVLATITEASVSYPNAGSGGTGGAGGFGDIGGFGGPGSGSLRTATKTVEEQNQELVDSVLEHGYDTIDGEFRPPADSLTQRHINIITGIVESLRIKQATIQQEIENRIKDAREVEFTLFGYEQALVGFQELQLQEEQNARAKAYEGAAFATEASVEVHEEVVASSIATMEHEAELSSSIVEENDTTQKDAPRLPETADQVVDIPPFIPSTPDNLVPMKSKKGSKT